MDKIITIKELIEIAESANIPSKDKNKDMFVITREFLAKNDWKVIVFYDGDEVDYIDHFVAPDGEIINFWDWPVETEGRDKLIFWRPSQ